MSSIEGHKLTKEQLDEIKKLKDSGDIEGYQNFTLDAVIGLHTKGGPEPCQPIPCPPNMHFDMELCKCVPTEPGPCPEGQHRDPITGECVPDEPEPEEPTLPNDGREQFNKGGNMDAKTWKVVAMRDDPTLFKIVDGADVNIADQFHSHTNAQQFIDYYIWKQSQPGPEPECPPGQHKDPVTGECVPDTEPEPGSSTTKDGVTVPFKVKGEWKYDVREDWRDGGARFNIPAAGTSVVMVGYFTASKDGGDEVSAKGLGGRHSNDIKYDGCIYDLGIGVNGKQPRLRCECPHPDYTGTISTGEDGITFVGRFTGMMAAFIQEQAGVRVQYWQDQGDAETKPANQWKKLFEFFDDGTKISGIEGADRFPLRKLPSTAQNTWRIDETPGLKQKWIAIAEIDVS